MKRTIPLLLISLLLIQLLCGCSDTSASSSNAAATPDSAPAVQPQLASKPATEKPTEAPLTTEELTEKYIKKILDSKAASSAHIDVDPIDQYPELPTGCESVALTMALNALGADLDKTDIAEHYLRYDDNYILGFCGDPFSDGGAGVMPPGIIATVENYTADTGASVYACNTSHMPLSDLYKFIDAGCPVLIWTTYYIGEPMYTDDYYEYDGETYYWYDNEHCVTLCGYDRSSGTVEIADPMQGIVTVDADYFERINSDIGGWSVAIIDTSDIAHPPIEPPRSTKIFKKTPRAVMF